MNKLTNWFRGNSHTRRTTKRQPHVFRPSLEVLEDRLVPAAIDVTGAIPRPGGTFGVNSYDFSASAGDLVQVSCTPTSASLFYSYYTGGSGSVLGIGTALVITSAYVQTFQTFPVIQGLVEDGGYQGVSTAAFLGPAAGGRASADVDVQGGAASGSVTLGVSADAYASQDPLISAFAEAEGVADFFVIIGSDLPCTLAYSSSAGSAQLGGGRATAGDYSLGGTQTVDLLPFNGSGGVVVNLQADAFCNVANGGYATQAAAASVSAEWSVIDLRPYIGLFDPANNLVATGADALEYAATQTGTYTLKVTDQGNNDFGLGFGNPAPTTGAYHLTISAAPVTLTPTVDVTPVSATNDGSPHSTTAEVFGVGGIDLGPAVVTYNTADGSAPVDAGTYIATGTFAGNQDYAAATGTATIVIDKAFPAPSIKPVVETDYDGQAHGTTGQVVGANGVVLSNTVIYTDSQGNVSASAPVDAGTYTATVSYAGDNNYWPASDSTTIVIDRAFPAPSINPVAETPYDGLPHGTTGQVLGANGDVLSNTVVYTDSLGNTLNGSPVHAGTYTATISYAGDNNYTFSNASTTIVIDKADATITITPYTVQYDGFGHRLLGTATGVQGEDISNLLDLGTVGVNAGTYWENWRFAGNTDYNSANGLDPFIIDRAPVLVTTKSSIMLVGTKPPALAGTVNGNPFTGSTAFTTVQGDTLTVTLSSSVTARSPVGAYPIIATVTGLASANYLPPTPGSIYVVTVGHDSGSGAKNVSFWDNKGNAKLITATDLTALDQLNLRNDNGSNFDPTVAAQLQSWFRSDADRIVKSLSVQLATMDLNVLSGYVKTTDVVYAGNLLQFVGSPYYNVTGLDGGGFITIGNLMTLANSALANYTPPGKGDNGHDRLANYLDALEDALEAGNDNTSFVQQSVPSGI